MFVYPYLFSIPVIKMGQFTNTINLNGFYCSSPTTPDFSASQKKSFSHLVNHHLFMVLSSANVLLYRALLSPNGKKLLDSRTIASRAI